MNDIQEVEVVIAPDGGVEIKVNGVKGEGCLAVTEEMLSLLGQELQHRELTDEYYMKSEEEQHDWDKQSSW